MFYLQKDLFKFISLFQKSNMTFWSFFNKQMKGSATARFLRLQYLVDYTLNPLWKCKLKQSWGYS